MVEATDLITLGNGLWLWQAYDPATKADLSSSAVRNGDQLILVDPIPLAPAAVAKLKSLGTVSAVIVTNSNHARAAAAFAAQLDVPVFASEAGVSALQSKLARTCAEGEIMPGLAAIPIKGAAPGEMVFHFAQGRGTLVIGDALINFQPYGFCLLPAKYCSNQRLMRASLRQLLDWPFERLLFAHGSPILAAARARLTTHLG